VTRLDRVPKHQLFSYGLWIAAIVAALPGVDAMHCLLAQLLIIAAWGGDDAS
jgi:hypothetical protein